MSPLIAGTNSRIADWLWYSAHTIVGVMPVVMAIGAAVVWLRYDARQLSGGRHERI